jgi:hypothetical protein
MKRPALIGLLIALTGCTVPTPPTAPPENYKGPIAERPVTFKGDYWIYERADKRKVKVETAQVADLEFPLWVGKTWKARGHALRAGQPLTSKAGRIVVEIDVEVTAYKQIQVPAGTFDAFEIKFVCTVFRLIFEPECGQWTIWYAPKVKNIVSIESESTATSQELAEYKLMTPSN